MSITVLRMGLDWFEVSFTGQIEDKAADKLDSLKSLAASRKEPVAWDDAFPHELFVSPRTYSPWSWVLKNREMHIRLNRGGARNDVSAQVLLTSFGLANNEPTLLFDMAVHAVSTLGSFKPYKVSRADVCVDFQGWQPTPGDMENIVCSARKRSTHGTAAGVETFTYGRGGPALFRLYNKTQEVHDNPDKVYFEELWRFTDRYDPEQIVWRAEVQLRRDKLKELGMHAPSQVLANPAALLDFGMSWCQLRVPTDKNKTRWPEDPRWTQIRTATYQGPPLQRKLRVPELMSLDRVQSSFIGNVATAGAYFECDDYWDTLKRLSLSVEVAMMDKDIDFPELVARKRSRILSGE